MPSLRSHSVVGLILSLACVLSHAGLASAQDRARMLGSPVLGAMIEPWSATAPAPAPSVDPLWQAWDPTYQMRTAELRAAPGGNRVLHTAESMIASSDVVRGSCYDWVDAVFERAGGQRHDVFHGSITRGPYARAEDIQPGDWVLFINESYGGDPSHTHSAIFVGWADESSRTAVMMSYPGGRREEPGRYGTYALTRAYRVIRLDDAPPAPRPTRRHGAPRPHGATRTHAHH